MSGWLIALRDRPIAQDERHAAMVTVAVLLTAIALLLVVTQPQRRRDSATHSESRSSTGYTPAFKTGRGNFTPTTLTPAVEDVAGRFLAGYLSYVYGRAPASHVKGASGSLIRSLESHPPRVPPGIQARHPRVLSLRATTAPADEVGVTAVVNDGGLIDFPVGLLLKIKGGRLLVSELDGA
jgi:hypothetical protein